MKRPREQEKGSRAEQFAQYVRGAAKRAGYDIDSPRGGGRTALARETGMSLSSVGRMLSGQTLPDPATFHTLADVLNVPIYELLVHSGLIPQNTVIPNHHIKTPQKKTPRKAALELGITDPRNVELFEAVVENMLMQERGDNARESNRGAA